MPARRLFVRHAPLRPFRRLVRAYRSRSNPQLAVPLVLAVTLAGAGQWVVTRAAASQSGPAPVTTATAPDRGVDALTAPVAAVPARLAPPPRRTPDRASRGAARVAPPAPPRKPAAKPVRRARWVRPVRAAVTSRYGMRWGRMHNGIDFGAPTGTPVVAAFDGTIVSAGYGPSGYGLRVVIRHPGGVTTTYNHLSSVVVRRGHVKAGQAIARVGSTGNSTGPHLHFEVLRGGHFVDPLRFLRDQRVKI